MCNQNFGCLDHGPFPYVTNIEKAAVLNENFRTGIWTGKHLQMTIMCIPAGEDIGAELHPCTDQMIRIEQGQARFCIGPCKRELKPFKNVCSGDVIFIPAGTWHNLINTGRCPLKVSSVYTPPNHPFGTVQKNARDVPHDHDEVIS